MELMSRPREARLSQQRQPQKQNDLRCRPSKSQSVKAQGLPLMSLEEKGKLRLTWKNWWSVCAGSGCILCPPLHRCGPAFPWPPYPVLLCSRRLEAWSLQGSSRDCTSHRKQGIQWSPWTCPCSVPRGLAVKLRPTGQEFRGSPGNSHVSFTVRVIDGEPSLLGLPFGFLFPPLKRQPAECWGSPNTLAKSPAPKKGNTIISNQT